MRSTNLDTITDGQRGQITYWFWTLNFKLFISLWMNMAVIWCLQRLSLMSPNKYMQELLYYLKIERSVDFVFHSNIFWLWFADFPHSSRSVDWSQYTRTYIEHWPLTRLHHSFLWYAVSISSMVWCHWHSHSMNTHFA